MKTKNDNKLFNVLPDDGVRTYELILRDFRGLPVWFKVYVENYNGKYYLSYIRCGSALCQCQSMRLRKTMTIADVLKYVENNAIV